MTLVMVVYSPTGGEGGGPREAAAALREAAEAGREAAGAAAGRGAASSAADVRTVLVLPSASASFALFEYLGVGGGGGRGEGAALEGESGAALEAVGRHVHASVGSAAPAARCQMHVVDEGSGVYDDTGPAEAAYDDLGDAMTDAVAVKAVEAAARAGQMLKTLKIRDRAAAAAAAGMGVVRKASEALQVPQDEPGGHGAHDEFDALDAAQGGADADEGRNEEALAEAGAEAAQALRAGWQTFSSWGKSVLREVTDNVVAPVADPLEGAELSSNPVFTGEEEESGTLGAPAPALEVDEQAAEAVQPPAQATMAEAAQEPSSIEVPPAAEAQSAVPEAPQSEPTVTAALPAPDDAGNKNDSDDEWLDDA